MTTMPSETGAAKRTSHARRAGIVLIGASLLSIVMMAHHPHAASQGAAEIAAEIVDKASIARFVHGALIALLGAQLFAFVEFCRLLDRDRATVRLGFVAYAAGIGAMTGAALISGFLVPDLAARYAALGASDLDVFRHLLRLCMAGNQVLAKFGVVAMSIGIVAWSIALFRRARGNAWVGAIGLLAGLAPAIALLCGVLVLDVPGMTLVVVLQTIWNLAVGIQLVREKF
jgi:hypothetical protein